MERFARTFARDHDAALPAVQRCKDKARLAVTVSSIAERCEASRRASFRRLGQDDFGAELGEDARAELRVGAGEVENADVAEHRAGPHSHPPEASYMSAYSVIHLADPMNAAPSSSRTRVFGPRG
jgi:hypothetical protein